MGVVRTGMTVTMLITGTYVEGCCVPGSQPSAPHGLSRSILNSEGEAGQGAPGTGPPRMGRTGAADVLSAALPATPPWNLRTQHF